jgi:hypothetical protein
MRLKILLGFLGFGIGVAVFATSVLVCIVAIMKLHDYDGDVSPVAVPALVGVALVGVIFLLGSFLLLRRVLLVTLVPSLLLVAGGVGVVTAGLIGVVLIAPQPPGGPRAPLPPLSQPESSPTSQSPSPQLSSLDAALDKLVSGNIAFNTPDRIPLGKSQIIEAKLSTNMPPTVLLDQLNEAGAKVSASIKVADRMVARLDGGGAFDVSPSGPQQQFISKEQVTTWTWLVTPKQPGTQFLILSFDAVLTVDGKDGTRNINTFKRKIEIDVPWPGTLSEWFAFLKNWFENISWLWLTILVPAGLWLWNQLRKKPSQKKPPP